MGHPAVNKIIVPEGMAWCSKCRQALPVDRFHFNKKRGYDGYCKVCRKQRYLETSTCKRRVEPPQGHHYCSHCKTIKPDSEFQACEMKIYRNGDKAKRSAYCRECKYLINITPRQNKKKSARHGLHHQVSKTEVRHKISTDPCKLAYAAGVVDAEGTAAIARRVRAPRISLSIAGDSHAILDHVQSIIGGKVWFHKRLKRFKDGTMRLVSNGRLSITSMIETKAICEALMPYLRLRAERCELLVRAISAHPNDRVVMSEEMAKLNKKGISDDPLLPESKHFTIEQVKAIKEADIAYLAGLVDGDGFIGIEYRKPGIKVALTKYAPLEFCHATFGGTIFHDKDDSPRANRLVWIAIFSRIYSYECWSNFLPRLIKHLVLKRPQAELALVALNEPSLDIIELLSLQCQVLTQDARREKFRRVESAPSDKALVFSLSDYAHFDYRDIDRKRGVEIQIPESTPMPEISTYSLSEYAKNGASE